MRAVAKPRPKRNWIQEERRRTLGDWVAFCLDCGNTLRYFHDFEGELPAACPSCHARFPSAFQVECEDCGAALRPNELFGVPIRREGR